MDKNFLHKTYTDFAWGKIDINGLEKTLKKAEAKTGTNYIFPENRWLMTGGTYAALIYVIGVYHKRFSYTKEEYARLLALLKHFDFSGAFMRRAMHHWPYATETELANIEKFKANTNKLPVKPLKLKEDLFRSISEIKLFEDIRSEIFEIIYKGDQERYSKSLFLQLLEKLSNLSIDTVVIYYIIHALNSWDGVNWKEAEQIIKNTYLFNYFGKEINSSLKTHIVNNFPKNITQSEKEVDKIKTGSKKLPVKKYKL